MHQRRPFLLRSWCIFPPVSDLTPCFRKIFRFFGKFQKCYLFPKSFCDFLPPKFLMTFFLVIDHKLWIPPPILPVLVHSPPDWRKLLFPPTFTNFPPQCTYWTPPQCTHGGVDQLDNYDAQYRSSELQWYEIHVHVVTACHTAATSLLSFKKLHG